MSEYYEEIKDVNISGDTAILKHASKLDGCHFEIEFSMSENSINPQDYPNLRFYMTRKPGAMNHERKNA